MLATKPRKPKAPETTAEGRISAALESGHLPAIARQLAREGFTVLSEPPRLVILDTTRGRARIRRDAGTWVCQGPHRAHLCSAGLETVARWLADHRPTRGEQ